MTKLLRNLFSRRQAAANWKSERDNAIRCLKLNSA